MDITTRAAAGPLPVSVVTAKRPFAVIELGPDASYMSLDDVADCDRLIIAATNAKRRLEAALAGTPHGYRDAADAPGHCDACGQYENERDGDSIHAAACGAVAPHSGVTCVRPPGHNGFHESGHTPAIVWERVSVASDEAAAVLAASIASGQPVTVTDDEPRLALEVRNQADGTVRLGTTGGPLLDLTPALGEDYWAYRVMIGERQAVVGFPKFSTIGIGFAVEDDWNTNLPYRCETEEIFQHIAHNKGDDAISDDDVREAIRMIQAQATADRDGQHHPEDPEPDPDDAAPEVCGLPVWGNGPDCPLFAGHEPMPGCPGAGERISLRIAKGAS